MGSSARSSWRRSLRLASRRRTDGKAALSESCSRSEMVGRRSTCAHDRAARKRVWFSRTRAVDRWMPSWIRGSSKIRSVEPCQLRQLQYLSRNERVTDTHRIRRDMHHCGREPLHALQSSRSAIVSMLEKRVARRSSLPWARASSAQGSRCAASSAHPRTGFGHEEARAQCARASSVNRSMAVSSSSKPSRTHGRDRERRPPRTPD